MTFFIERDYFHNDIHGSYSQSASIHCCLFVYFPHFILYYIVVYCLWIRHYPCLCSFGMQILCFFYILWYVVCTSFSVRFHVFWVATCKLFNCYDWSPSRLCLSLYCLRFQLSREKFTLHLALSVWHCYFFIFVMLLPWYRHWIWLCTFYAFLFFVDCSANNQDVSLLNCKYKFSFRGL